jgi:hypothetical protein
MLSVSSTEPENTFDSGHWAVERQNWAVERQNWAVERQNWAVERQNFLPSGPAKNMYFWSGKKYVLLVRQKIWTSGPAKNMDF